MITIHRRGPSTNRNPTQPSASRTVPRRGNCSRARSERRIRPFVSAGNECVTHRRAMSATAARLTSIRAIFPGRRVRSCRPSALALGRVQRARAPRPGYRCRPRRSPAEPVSRRTGVTSCDHAPMSQWQDATLAPRPAAREKSKPATRTSLVGRGFASPLQVHSVPACRGDAEPSLGEEERRPTSDPRRRHAAPLSRSGTQAQPARDTESRWNWNSEVVGGERFALHDRGVELGLVEPGGVGQGRCCYTVHRGPTDRFLRPRGGQICETSDKHHGEDYEQGSCQHRSTADAGQSQQPMTD